MRRETLTFVLGILVASAMLPVSVVAATSLVRIQGPSGDVAGVDAAKQLYVVESNPASFVTKSYTTSGGGSCFVIQYQPSTSALIVKQIRIVDSSEGGAESVLGIFPNRTCTGQPFFIHTRIGQANRSDTFEPGVPVKAGAGVSGQWFGAAYSTIQIYGYNVPPATVP